MYMHLFPCGAFILCNCICIYSLVPIDIMYMYLFIYVFIPKMCIHENGFLNNLFLLYFFMIKNC